MILGGDSSITATESAEIVALAGGVAYGGSTAATASRSPST